MVRVCWGNAVLREDITQALDRGEGMHIEFKEQLPPGYQLARAMCAFANCKGGKIYIGIKDKGDSHEERVCGVVNPDDTISKAQNMANDCDPPVQAHIEKIPLDHADPPTQGVLVEVFSSQSPNLHTCDGGKIYKRVGSESKRASSSELTAMPSLCKGRDM